MKKTELKMAQGELQGQHLRLWGTPEERDPMMTEIDTLADLTPATEREDPLTVLLTFRDSHRCLRLTDDQIRELRSYGFSQDRFSGYRMTIVEREERE
ncbi:MAG: hypothetical protein LUC33_03080 [Prevotellaceae bacterium]|nr:hypothetical protein [Prevotellaceae bacterium]